MSKHTWGLLQIQSQESALDFAMEHWIQDANGEDICSVLDHEVARRLVACWNACEGLSTEAVEFTIIRQREMLALKTQRDELLAALLMVRDADDDCKRDGLQTIPSMARNFIDANIAKVNQSETS